MATETGPTSLSGHSFPPVSSIRPLHNLTQAVAAAPGLPGIYDAALDCLTRSLGVERASVLLFDPDSVMRFKAWRGLSDQYRRAVEGHTPWTPETRDPQPVLVRDVFADPSLEEYGEIFESEGIAAVAFIPLVASGQLLGKFMLYYASPHEFADDEVLLAETIASQVAFAIYQHNSQLELRLRKSQYQELVESLGLAVYTTDADGRIALYNEAAVRLWGREPRAGHDLWCGSWRIFTPEGLPVRLEDCPMAIALREDRPVRGEEIVIEKPDGSRVWVLPHPTPLHDRDGNLTGAVNVLVDLTERKDAERALRESDERFRLAAQGSQIGAWEWDLGEKVIWSETLEQIYGYGQGEFPGTLEAFIGRLHPDDRERIHGLIEAAVREGSSLDFEERIILPSGEVRWLHSRAQALPGPDGRTARLAGICMDVTQRKQAEQEREDLFARLSEQTAILQTVQEVGETVAGELDVSKAVQAVTDAATKLTNAQFGAFFYNVSDASGAQYMLYTLSGADPQKFAGFPLPRATPLFAPTFQGEGIVRVDDVLADPRYGQMAPHYGMPEGHLPVRSYLAVPVMSRAGAVLGGLFLGHSNVGVFTEMHETLVQGVAGWAGLAIENAQLYEASQRANQALRESEARYRDIFNSAGVPVWEEDYSAVKQRITQLQSEGVTDFREYLQGHPDALQELVGLVKIVDVNDEAVRTMGARDKSEALCSLHDLFTPDTDDAFIDQILLLVSGERSLSRETVVRTLTGELRDILFTLVYVDAPEKYNRVLVTWTDITDRKRAEDELREAASIKDQFVGLISHELRTPISTVIANGTILARRGHLLTEGDRQQALDDIVLEGARLQAIIENLLLLSRLETSAAIEWDSLPLQPLIDEVVEDFRRREGLRQVSIAERADASLVSGQAGLLGLAVQNLLSNAAKYSASDSQIEVGLQTTSDGWLEVHVRDRGIGIQDGDFAGLFTPFFRAEQARGYASGMGLGLAVCKRIVEAHGGRVWATPRDGGGSDFAFSLPCIRS